MPSVFGHVLVPLSLRVGLGARRMNLRLAAFCAFSAVLPDLDTIGYALGVPYGSVWAHRGASHSLVFALGWVLQRTGPAGDGLRTVLGRPAFARRRYRAAGMAACPRTLRELIPRRILRDRWASRSSSTRANLPG